MADGRITDYTNVEVSTGAIIDPAWANTETGNIETSINNGNDVMIDLEQNYASASAPTSAPNGKFWYDSGASANYFKGRVGGAWSIVPHDGLATAFAFGGGLTVASNFAVSGAAAFGDGLTVASNAAVAGSFSVANATYGATQWSAENLILNYSSNTEVTISADRIMCVNSDGIPKFIDDVALTGDVSTDYISGTTVTSYVSMWQAIWVDSDSTVLIVPEFESTTTTSAANKLIDSGGTFVTIGVSIGDVVYNTTDYTSTTVTAIDSSTQLSVADDIFDDSEDYKIHQLSPTGIGTFNAHIGYAYNNSSSNLDDSGYTRPELQKPAVYKGGGLDFSVSGAAGTWNEVSSWIFLSQFLDFSGRPIWQTAFILDGDFSASTTSDTLTISGLAGFISSFPIVVSNGAGATDMIGRVTGSGIDVNSGTARTAYEISGTEYAIAKPTFATRS